MNTRKLTLSVILCLLAVALGPLPLVHGASANSSDGPLGIVPGAARMWAGDRGFVLEDKGPDKLVSVDPTASTTSVIGSQNLPGGIRNFAGALDSAGSRYFYQTSLPGSPLGQGANLHVIDTQSGTLLRTWPLSEAFVTLDYDPATGTLLGIVPGAVRMWFGNPGFVLEDKGPDKLVRLDPTTGAISVVGSPNLPGGIRNFAGALDSAGSRYFYQTSLPGSPLGPGANLHVINTQSGALLTTWPLTEAFVSMDYDPAAGTLVGIVPGAVRMWAGDPGFVLEDKGPDKLVRVDLTTGTASVIGSPNLPGGIRNFAGTLDSAGSRYFYQTSVPGAPLGAGANLHVVNTQSGELIATIPLQQAFVSLDMGGPPPIVKVDIAIKPGTEAGRINPQSNGVTPVSILTTDAFDASTVAPSTVRFGRLGKEAAPAHYALEDVDGDGQTDITFQFRTQETGIRCGDMSASLSGKSLTGKTIKGTGSISTGKCK